MRPFPAVLLPRDELIMITGDDLRRRPPDAAIERPDSSGPRVAPLNPPSDLIAQEPAGGVLDVEPL